MEQRNQKPIIFFILCFANFAMLMMYAARGSATDVEAAIHLVLSVVLLIAALLFLRDSIQKN